MKNRLAVCTVVKPHGVGGAIKVKPISNRELKFSSEEVVYIEDAEYTILKSSPFKEGLLLWLDSIDTFERASGLSGKLIETERKYKRPPDGGFYIIDLVGAVVKASCGEVFGKIQEIDNFGSADVVLCADENGKEFRFAFLQDIVEKIDVEKKEFVVKREKFLEVVVF